MVRSPKDIFPAQERPGHRQNIRALKIIAAILVLVLVVGVVWAGIWLRRAARVPDSPIIQAELQKIRDAGHPVTIEELRASYTPPTEEEDATEIVRHVRRLTTSYEDANPGAAPFYLWDIPPLKERIDAQTMGRLQRLVDTNEEALEYLGADRPFRGLRFPAADFAVEFDPLDRDAMYGMFGDAALYSFDSITEVLLQCAMHDAETGDGDRALILLINVVDAVQLTRAEPDDVQSTRALTIGSLLTPLNRVLNLTRPDAVRMAELRQALAEADDSQPFIDAAIATRCYGIANFEPEPPFFIAMMLGRYESSGFHPGNYHRSERTMRLKGKTRDMELFLIHANLGIDYMQMPERERPPRYFVDKFRTLRKELAYAPEDLIVTGNFRHRIDHGSTANEFFQQGLRIAIIALATEEFQRANGRYPHSLDELNDDFGPLNTFNPLEKTDIHFQSDESGYIVGSPRYGIATIPESENE